jgi:hypothetical protein
MHNCLPEQCELFDGARISMASAQYSLFLWHVSVSATRQAKRSTTCNVPLSTAVKERAEQSRSSRLTRTPFKSPTGTVVKQQHGSERTKKAKRTENSRRNDPDMRRSEYPAQASSQAARPHRIRTLYSPFPAFRGGPMSFESKRPAIFLSLYLYDRAVNCPAACRKPTTPH